MPVKTKAKRGRRKPPPRKARFLVKTRHLVGFKPYFNPYKPYKKRWPIWSDWETRADADTYEGARELRREFVLSEVREGLKYHRQWSIWYGSKQRNVMEFGIKNRHRVS